MKISINNDVINILYLKLIIFLSAKKYGIRVNKMELLVINYGIIN